MTGGPPPAFGLARVCGLGRAVTVVTRANYVCVLGVGPTGTTEANGWLGARCLGGIVRMVRGWSSHHDREPPDEVRARGARLRQAGAFLAGRAEARLVYDRALVCAGAAA